MEIRKASYKIGSVKSIEMKIVLGRSNNDDDNDHHLMWFDTQVMQDALDEATDSWGVKVVIMI